MSKREKAKRPLRRIIDTKAGSFPGNIVEVLECGHEQRERKDIYGPTNAERRRCRQCVAA